MALAIADLMADGQVVCVAVATIDQRLNMFQRRCLGRNVCAAHPAGHHAMQLAGYCSVHFDAEVLQAAHAGILIHIEHNHRHACKTNQALTFNLPSAIHLPTM